MISASLLVHDSDCAYKSVKIDISDLESVHTSLTIQSPFIKKIHLYPTFAVLLSPEIVNNLEFLSALCFIRVKVLHSFSLAL